MLTINDALLSQYCIIHGSGLKNSKLNNLQLTKQCCSRAATICELDPLARAAIDGLLTTRTISTVAGTTFDSFPAPINLPLGNPMPLDAGLGTLDSGARRLVDEHLLEPRTAMKRHRQSGIHAQHTARSQAHEKRA